MSFKPYLTLSKNLLRNRTHSPLIAQTNYRTELVTALQNLTNHSTLSIQNSSLSVSTKAQSFYTPLNDPYLTYNANSFFSKERITALYNLSINSSHLLARHNNQTIIDTRILAKLEKSTKCKNL